MTHEYDLVETLGIQNLDHISSHLLAIVSFWVSGFRRTGVAQAVDGYTAVAEGEKVSDLGGPKMGTVGPAMSKEKVRLGGRGKLDIVGVVESTCGFEIFVR
jgi:hypothetical protein